MAKRQNKARSSLTVSAIARSVLTALACSMASLAAIGCTIAAQHLVQSEMRRQEARQPSVKIDATSGAESIFRNQPPNLSGPLSDLSPQGYPSEFFQFPWQLHGDNILLVSSGIPQEKLKVGNILESSGAGYYPPLAVMLHGGYLRDAAMRLAMGALDENTGYDACHRLSITIREAAVREGVSSQALSVEVIRPSIVDSSQITRYTAFLPESKTCESLLSAIRDSVDPDCRVVDTVLSRQRMLLQVYQQELLCVEILCIKAPELLTALPDSAAPARAVENRELLVNVPANNVPLPESERKALQNDKAAQNDTQERIEMAALIKGAVMPAYPGRMPKNPKLAIVIDDGGYGGVETERVFALQYPLTLAILPDTPYGRHTASQGAAKGFEIILHMPMQSGNGGRNTFPGELTLTMEALAIRERAEQCFAQYPEAVGANNHTGGLFTSQRDKVSHFLDVVQGKKKYFIDSKTAAASCAHELAMEKRIPCVQRDVFLDHDNDIAEVRKQFNKAVEHARTRGSCLAIGHFRKNTITVLEEELPKLKMQGVDLVHASELVW